MEESDQGYEQWDEKCEHDINDGKNLCNRLAFDQCNPHTRWYLFLLNQLFLDQRLPVQSTTKQRYTCDVKNDSWSLERPFVLG